MERDADTRQEGKGDDTAKEDVELNGIDGDAHLNPSARTSNDLIIDEGFPVLNNYIPPSRSTKSNPNQKQIGGKDRTNDDKDNYDPNIIPRYPFAAFPSAINIHPSQMTNMLSDFQEAFDARTKEDSAAYSTGSTYFTPAGMKPRCALEYLALSIFKSHTEGLVVGKHYDLETSGAEWWTLVLDCSEGKDDEDSEDDGGGKPKAATMKNGKGDAKDGGEEDEKDDDDDDSDDEQDEIGMHFDADYGIEEQLPNFMIHPRVATVTYLSDVGVPTLILNKRSPPSTDVQKLSLNGPIDTGWLSCPMIGKHIAFDGRLLHGSQGEFFPGGSINKIQNHNGGDDDERMYKRQKLDTKDYATIPEKQTESNLTQGTKQRFTFMVNVWLNHCPLDAELIEDDLIARMKTAWKDEKGVIDGVKSTVDTIEEEKKQGVARKNNGTAIPINGYTPPFIWSLPNVTAPSKLQKVEMTGIENMSEWAGCDTAVMCKREVAMQFRPTMKDCRRASKLAFDADGKSIELSFKGNALCLEVGDEVVDSDEESS